MADGKWEDDKLLQIEKSCDSADFHAYLYSADGVVRVASFPFKDGWTSADLEEMMIEALAIVKKNRKKFKIRPKDAEEPS